MMPTLSSSAQFSEREPVTVKSPATIDDQLQKLRERGMVIDDEKAACATLERINYYRLVHYFAVFLDNSGNYIEGTRFEEAIKLYDFDRKFRVEILAALEEIEVAVRAAVSNFHAMRYGAVGYLNGDTFDRRHNHSAFRSKIKRMIDKNSDLTFVRHHNKKYGGSFPLWVIMEMFSFGALVFFYQDLKLNDKKEIAKHYFNLDYRNVENWLENLANLRNHCAHYNRIYGNPLPWVLRVQELEPPKDSDGNDLPPYQMGSTLFDYLFVIRLLHKRGSVWGKEFVGVVEQLFRDYSSIVNPKAIGFQNNWQELFVKEISLK